MGPEGLRPAEAPMFNPTTFTRVNQGDPEALLGVEWLLTNGLGGFSMGTALGTPTRRYHALLVASLNPPVQRVMALGHVAESIIIDPGAASGPGGAGPGGEERFELSCFRFRPGVLHPRGDSFLQRFEKDLDARWHYKAGPLGIVKTVHLFHQANCVSIRYEIDCGAATDRPIRLTLRPLVGLRDFHALNLRELARDRFKVESPSPGGAVVCGPAGRLHLWTDCPAGGCRFAPEEQWWFDFQYDQERDRGYDFLEDLYHPGVFIADLPAGRSVRTLTLFASIDPPAADRRDPAADRRKQEQRQGAMLEYVRDSFSNRGALPLLPALISAADDFVVRRTAPAGDAAAGANGEARATIIAGYPWFADWGRDSMIALPGLLLVTGRHAEARSVLQTFAAAAVDGLVPNVFDDYTGQPHYNTVDASLWFIHACCRYLARTADADTFRKSLLPVCRSIIAAYTRGTRYGIAMDDRDALITAGDATTQLTWMDAKRDGVTFTPRQGKAVEINALWCNALAALARAIADEQPAEAAGYRSIHDKAARSFRAKFWNPAAGCLFDTLAPGPNGAESPQGEIRPNQIFAASLRFAPLDQTQRRAVIGVVRARLLTPRGVRTLDPADWRYKGRYRGRMFERDAAYHNGTAWPWLLGPLAEAVLRTDQFSAGACAEARTILAPILAFLDADCLGQLPEVFDGDDATDDRQRAGGCPAQAWSVAEALRVSVLIARAEAGVPKDEL